MEERLATFKAVATFIGTLDDIRGELVENAMKKQAEAERLEKENKGDQ